MSSRMDYIFLVILLFINTATSYQPIVSTLSLKPGHRLSVFCDASRVTFNSSVTDETFESVDALAIYWMNTAGTEHVNIARYDAKTVDEDKQTFQDIPNGRNWRVTFAGDNNGTNNKETMMIKLDIYDSRCEDAGTYLCRVVAAVTFGATKYDIVYAQTNEIVEANLCPVLSTNVSSANTPVHIQCDLTRFNIPRSDVRTVTTLSIYRKKSLGKENDQIIAQYQSDVFSLTEEGLSANKFKDNPKGWKWKINFSRETSAVKQSKDMSIEWVISDPSYRDLGWYRCDINYINTNNKSVEVKGQEYLLSPRVPFREDEDGDMSGTC